MSEQINTFEEKLKELVSFAHKNKDVVEMDKINNFMHEMNLNVHQIDHIYEYLEANNIIVISMNDNDAEPDDDILLEMEDPTAQSCHCGSCEGHGEGHHHHHHHGGHSHG